MGPLIIFVLVTIAALSFVWFLFSGFLPFGVAKYRQRQERIASKLELELEESFVFWEKNRIFLVASAPLIFAGISFFLFQHLLAAVAGAIIGLGFPNMLIAITKGMRLKKIQNQLPDTAMMLSSSLKAGLSLTQAIEVVGEEMPAPICHEFRFIVKENKWGISLEESLRRLRLRVPVEEVNLLVSSILIARESGGDLPKVLSRMTTTIRNNLKLKEKIATFTLQGRMQGFIMMVLPFAFGYFVFKNNPGHFDVMLHTKIGKILLITAGCLQVLGMIIIQKISKVKI